jgi:glycerol-3-phosphate acyltransferase PlsY
MVQDLAALVVGYLLGAIPTGALVARLYRQVDLTRVGSRRTGATNVLRTLGPGAAAVVFLGDFFKGTAAVLLASAFTGGDSWAMALAGMVAVFGHAYSPFIGFRGGRGVTTGLGGLLPISPGAAGLGLLVGAATIAATRYVSLGSILGTSAAALALIAWSLTPGHSIAYVVFAVVVAGFIVIAHRDNIERLRRGTERRLGKREESESGGAGERGSGGAEE